MIGWYLFGFGSLLATAGVIGCTVFYEEPDKSKHHYIDLPLGNVTASLDLDFYNYVNDYLNKKDGSR